MKKQIGLVGWLLTLVMVLLPQVQAAPESADLMKQLKEIERSIKDNQRVASQTDATLQELRQDLFQTALKARDAKTAADGIAQQQAAGDEDPESLAALRNDIVNIGIVLREMRDRIDLMSKVTQAGQQLVDATTADVEALKAAVLKPDAAAEAAGHDLVARLEAQVDELTSLLAEKDKALAKATKAAKAAKTPEDVAITKPAPAETMPRPAAGPVSIEKAYELLAAGKVEAAAAQFDTLLSQMPDSVDARLGVALCRFESGDLDVSRQMVDEVLAVDDRNARGLGLLGALKYREGKMRDARRTLERALKYDETNAYNHNYLGIVLYESGRHEAAVAQVQKAVELDPGYTSALYNLSVLLATASKPDLAAARYYYEKSLNQGSPRSPMMDGLLGLTAP